MAIIHKRLDTPPPRDDPPSDDEEEELQRTTLIVREVNETGHVIPNEKMLVTISPNPYSSSVELLVVHDNNEEIDSSSENGVIRLDHIGGWNPYC